MIRSNTRKERTMPKILQNHYVLAVPNAQAAADFFINVLGFSAVPVGDKGWRFVKKDNCMVMLGSCPDAIHPGKLGDHSYFGYLVVDDVDGYYEEVRKNGIKILSPIESKPWKMR